MSKIDWDGKLQAVFNDGEILDAWIDPDWKDKGSMRLVAIEGHKIDGIQQLYAVRDSGLPVYQVDWRIQNKTEPKADAFDTAFREGSADIPQWAWDRMKAEYIEKDGMAASFARYVMTKEDAPIDPDLIAAREVVCGYHHDKHPESPWHIEQAEIVRSGRFDNMLDVQAAYHGIKRGRELERGEVK